MARLPAKLPSIFLVLSILIAPVTLAQSQVVQVNGNALAILNLNFADETEDPINVDVYFVNDTAYTVYGQSLNFPFDPTDAGLILSTIVERLNDENPTPSSASAASTPQIFIAAEENRESGLIEAWGSDYSPSGLAWFPCEINCSGGIALLNPGNKFTYAVVRPAGSPPPVAFVDGQWVTSLVESQGFVFFFTDGLVRDQNYISMIVMWPNNSKWDLFWGPEEGPGTALLEPWLSTSDMRARWVQEGAEGTLTVESCTRDCPLEDGTVAPFIKWFGDGLNPGGSQ